MFSFLHCTGPWDPLSSLEVYSCLNSGPKTGNRAVCRFNSFSLFLFVRVTMSGLTKRASSCSVGFFSLTLAIFACRAFWHSLFILTHTRTRTGMHTQACTHHACTPHNTHTKCSCSLLSHTQTCLQLAACLATAKSCTDPIVGPA